MIRENMESFELQAGNHNKTSVIEDDHDRHHDSKRGGWITFPFIIGNLAGLSVAAGGWGANWIVFLITKFNVGSVTATKINNVGFGFVNLFPVAGAVIADSFTGNFLVIVISSFVASLGMSMLTLVAAIDSLRPSPCSATASTACESPTKLQYLFLYAAMGLATIGFGGSRFTVATMGADQFDKDSRHQATFFNWFFVVFYVGNAVAFVVVVYVEDNVGWGLGFGICVLSTLVGLVVFLLGKPLYRLVKPNGSPFASIARVVFASIRKRNTPVPKRLEGSDYYFGADGASNDVANVPSKSFRFLNRAALKTETDRQQDGSYPQKSWRLCTVQEVEDLKEVIKILPLWSSGILLSITIAILNSFTTVQALTMDRHLGSIKVSAGTFLVFSLVSTALSIFVIDNFLLPLWCRMRGGRPITPLQRIGTGHVVSVLAMVGSALVEAKRLNRVRAAGLVHQPGSVAPISAFWLILGLAIVGFGEGFHFPGQVSLYYQEFPKSLKSTSTAMISLLIGLGYYLSAAFTDFVDRTTGWLPNNINEGRLDKVFWLCAIIGTANFGYYLVCSWLYKYKHDPNADDN